MTEVLSLERHGTDQLIWGLNIYINIIFCVDNGDTAIEKPLQSQEGKRTTTTEVTNKNTVQNTEQPAPAKKHKSSITGKQLWICATGFS